MVSNNGNGNGNSRNNDFLNLSEEERRHRRRAGLSVIVKPQALQQQKETNSNLLESIEGIKEGIKKIIKNTEKSSVKTTSTYAEAAKNHSRRLGYIRPVYSNKIYRLWSEFCTWAGCADKKPWDLVALLIIPTFLAGTTVGFNYLAKQSEMELARGKERQEALIKYIDEVPNIIYKKLSKPSVEEVILEVLIKDDTALKNPVQASRLNDKPSQISNKFLILLQVKTRAVLQLLEGDSQRRNILITFLKESQLSHKSDNFQVQPEILSELHGNIFQGINLKGIDLSEADLGQANLAKADLSKANLRGSILNSANLGEALLSSAKLSSKDPNWREALNQKIFSKKYNQLNTTLINTNLREANLIEADLKGTDLSRANLIGTDLRSIEYNSNTNFNKALYDQNTKFPSNFSQAKKSDMIEVKASMSPFFVKNDKDKNSEILKKLLSGMDLSKLQLGDVNWTGANLNNTNLEQTNLSDSTLTEVDFTNADLTNAIFKDVDLTNANLTNAIFKDVDLSKTQGLKEKQLLGAMLCNVTFPNELKNKIDKYKDRDCQKIEKINSKKNS